MNIIKTDVLYGMHPVQEALQAKRRKIYHIYTSKPAPKGFSALEAEISRRSIPITHCSREQLTHRAGTPDHQGIVAAVGPFPFRSKPFDSIKQPFLLLLDGLQDPRNVGAILRSASCMNVDGVIISQKASSPLTAAAVKASAGLSEHLEIMLAPSAGAAGQILEKAGYHLYVAHFGGQSLPEVSFKTPLCIVIGSEGTGVSAALTKKGTAVTIPQRKSTISYNASVAAGILLFAAAIQLKKI